MSDFLTVIASVTSWNWSNKQYSVNVNAIKPKDAVRVLTSSTDLKLTIGKMYVFEFLPKINKEREGRGQIIHVYEIFNNLDVEELFEITSLQFPTPVNFKELKKGITGYLTKITNPNIKAILNSIFTDYEKSFYISLAGLGMHHAYIGGLAHHTLSMLKLAEAYENIYQNLDMSYMYAGIILHDIAKTKEIDSLGQKYTLEGSLLGHLVMASDIILQYATKLGLQDTEECILLQHIVISHHGQLAFGSAKRPMTLEAFIISQIDSIDAKINGALDAVLRTKPGEFTEQINIIDKSKLYVPKSKKN